jgi:hypothetical protein
MIGNLLDFAQGKKILICFQIVLVDETTKVVGGKIIATYLLLS